MTDNKRFWIYILVVFGFGWLMQAAGMMLGGLWFTVCLSVCMFAPLLGVLISHGSLKTARTGIGWKAPLRGKVRWYLAAWFGPAALSILGAAVFFLLLPSRFDGRMSLLASQLEAVEAAGQSVPFTPALLAVITLLQSISYAPLFNMLFAVGEETGWRGYMTPYLTERFGRTKGLLLSGAIWGAWHWPVIALVGYNFGTGYPAYPLPGLLAMCLGCAALGILLSLLYDKTGSIWAPALAHGAVNAAAGIGALFLVPGNSSRLLGPTLFGLVAGIPLFALAAWVLLRKPAPEPEAAPEE